MSTDVRQFFGWRMVAVAFFVDFVAVGFFFYSYGVFFKAIAVEFGGSRLGASLGLTVSATVGAIAAPFIGRALDRYPLKRIIAIGTSLMAGGFLTLSLVRNPIEFYLAIGVFIGLGAGAMGGLATSKLVANWFAHRRGAALGIAATGISVSGVVMPFVSAALIEAYGWRTGFLAYGCFTALIVLPLVLRLVISAPEDVGQRPDGALPGAATPLAATGQANAPNPILKTRNFWVLVTIVGLMFCCQSATLTHNVPRLTDAGASLQTASLMMSLTAALGILGKLAFGVLADRWRARNAVWFTVALQIVGQLAMFRADDLALFAVGAALFGFGMGGVVPLQGALVGQMFGREQFGRALGAMRPAMLPLQVVGVPLAGLIYDRTQSYDPAFTLFIGLYVIAAIAALGFQEHQRTMPARSS